MAKSNDTLATTATSLPVPNEMEQVSLHELLRRRHPRTMPRRSTVTNPDHTDLSQEEKIKKAIETLDEALRLAMGIMDIEETEDTVED